jgi:hypothetical protein
MEEPIRVDLEAAQECKAIKMIEFLFTFCLAEKDSDVLTCDEKSLEQAFEEVKKIAKSSDTLLETHLSTLCVPATNTSSDPKLTLDYC